MYTMEYHSAIKKNKTTPFAATWVDQETLILSESDTKTNIPLICGILKKKGYKGTYSQNRSRATDIENKLMVTRG